MKTLKNIILFALITFSISCSKEDEEFFNAVYTTIPGLVTIEAQPSFAVNDVLWLNTNTFSRYLTEPNQTTPLDVYRTTNSETFSFLYRLEKQVNGEWENVAIGSNFIEDKGEMSIGNYITGIAFYNDITETYEYRGGLLLTQPGQYRLGFFSGHNGFNFDIISESANRSTFLTIATTAFNAPDGSGFYNFTVN
ncbi:hypothetical protein [Flavobacterium sp.]|jgi:hypothetical protein|uniref:hypothetical protein n=1 Tax=Flavobacterium sp. TaxID=239 RepID=UPI0037C120BA